MDVAALLDRHECLAQHAGAEMRNDDRDGRKPRCHCRESQRVTESKIEGRWQAELLPDANRQHAAMHEDCRATCSRRTKDFFHPLVVQLIAMHRGEEANGSQPTVVQEPRQPR
jgi:hypothetical protein